jgi:nucleotide-binding universal stress UspA family protein
MKDWNIKTIVLGYDGSEGADRAVRLAATLARVSEANVVVVSTFQTRSTNRDDEKIGRIIAKTQATAEDAVRELQKAGVTAEPDVLEGSAGETLLSVVESREADLIVVGRRGHGLVAHLLLGSTSEHVVRRAKVPVLVAH